MTAHSRGPINGLTPEQIEETREALKIDFMLDGDIADALCDMALRAATVEQATRAEAVEPMKYPCDCKLPPGYEGCACGNSDDSNSQGFAMGWNACLEAIRGPKERV